MEATKGSDLVLPHYLDAAFSNVNQFIDNTHFFFLQMITRIFLTRSSLRIVTVAQFFC